MARPRRTTVDSSMPVIWKAPSPTSATTFSSGRAIFAPSVAGTANPIDV